MKSLISTICSSSLLAQGPRVLVVGTRITRDVAQVENAMELFRHIGATIERHDSSGFDCRMSARRLLGFMYRDSVAIACRVELQADQGPFEPNIVIKCDLSNVRKVMRLYFYGLSFVVVAAATGQFLRGEGSWATWLAFGIPWVIAEGNFAADCTRLRARLLKLLEAG